MALDTDKEQVMNAISSLGFEVFRNGSFHWKSSNTPDMRIYKDGKIRCWTSSPFKDNKSNHGDLIDFIKLEYPRMNFIEAREKAHKLLNLELPSLDTYEGYSSETIKKDGFISKDFMKNFEKQRIENFDRYKELLNETLPSLKFNKQKEIAQKYQIGYVKQSDRLIMPILDDYGNILTLWKYNKNPKPFIGKDGNEIKLGKVLFSKGRNRTTFNLADLREYGKDKSIEVYLCGGEKDVLNMVGNGYRAVTLGAENNDIPKEHLELFSGLKIIIAYDYDKAGKDGTLKMLEQLKDVAQSVKTWDWENEAKKHKLKLFNGFDMTDFLTETKIKKNKLVLKVIPLD
jgi:DNA primase